MAELSFIPQGTTKIELSYDPSTWKTYGRGMLGGGGFRGTLSIHKFDGGFSSQGSGSTKDLLGSVNIDCKDIYRGDMKVVFTSPSNEPVVSYCREKHRAKEISVVSASTSKTIASFRTSTSRTRIDVVGNTSSAFQLGPRRAFGWMNEYAMCCCIFLLCFPTFGIGPCCLTKKISRVGWEVAVKGNNADSLPSIAMGIKKGDGYIAIVNLDGVNGESEKLALLVVATFRFLEYVDTTRGGGTGGNAGGPY